MSTDNYHKLLSKYSRMPYELCLQTIYLFILSISFQGLLSKVLMVISGFSLLFWLVITFYVALNPRNVVGFVLLRDYIFGGLVIVTITLFIHMWASSNTSDAFLIIVGMLVLGVLLTKLVIFLIRSIFGISQ